MQSVGVQVRSLFRVLILLGLVIAIAGCGAPEARFHVNRVYVRKQERIQGESFDKQNVSDVADVLAAMFGTPDQPHLPILPESGLEKVVDGNLLALSAGRVLSTKSGNAQGLFREHCVHCHGITGDGLGPTAAFLNPYPRDYRMGVFKFKSTPKGAKPSHEDLKKILVEGVAGTAMPSFKVLPSDELESLIHYVKYLAIRGEVERKLVEELGELEEKDRLIEVSFKKDNKAKFDEQIGKIKDIASGVIQKWVEAESLVTDIPARPEGWDSAEAMAASIKRGRELFYGTIANCVKCHGDSALGDGQITDFDDWAKDMELPKTDALAEYRKLGALEPRTIRPRNLRLGVYRGGRRPIDIYWRVHNGIDGTPMPAALMKPAGAPPETKGLAQDDIWALIDYVRSLPYESISKPEANVPTYARERN